MLVAELLVGPFLVRLAQPRAERQVALLAELVERLAVLLEARAPPLAAEVKLAELVLLLVELATQWEPQLAEPLVEWAELAPPSVAERLAELVLARLGVVQLVGLVQAERVELPVEQLAVRLAELVE